MKLAEIRSRFLKYFEKNGHTIIESSSLVPHGDPTLLFTNAGMNQFKDVFLGKDPRPYKRATSVQKCVRAGGKHNDLENVGFTARHHTFFEMLGNFSFGDYFKKDAIRFAWEFVTKELALPKDRLYVTVFEKDDEAADIWHRQEGVPLDRIYRFGEKDNFWSMGDTGPCGPCTEIFIDRGVQYSCGKPTCAMGCDCDRYMEFWNLVFMQFDRTADGKLNPLPKPSVDTGAGLERIAAILQNADSNYDTDLFREIIARTEKLAQAQSVSPFTYDPAKDWDHAVSYRVIADHSRATAFLVADGVLPSNEGRGYVLRRIIRRAIRHGKKLGFEAPFLNQTAGIVVDLMAEAYPDLKERKAFIEKVVVAEEEQFFRTLQKGLELLDQETAKLGSSKLLPGETAFKMYDTFGFPLDLTRVICEEKGLSVDEVGFEKSMDRQREESRKSWKGSGEAALNEVYSKTSAELKAKGKIPQFRGYTELHGHSYSEVGVVDSACLAILAPVENQLEKVDSFTTPSLAASADSIEKSVIIEVAFAETPFYGESGGQAGDRGRVRAQDGSFEGEVIDVQKPTDGLILAHVRPIRGSIRTGQNYIQETDRKLRALTARNHTATHLLHWALREVLGKHVKQAGSLVTSDLLRFDFNHFQALTEAELAQIEDMINERIWRGYQVQKKEMSKDQALAAGAIAMFGEKYGDQVRVVSVGDFSVELCGGTHVDNAADIHLFKIASENGIAAGVRRIIAHTSEGAFNYLRNNDRDLRGIRDRLKSASTEEIFARLERMSANEKELRRQIESFQSKSAAGEADALLGQAKLFAQGNARLVSGIVGSDALGIKRLRDMADLFKSKAPDAVVVLGMKDPEAEKVHLLVSVGPKAQQFAKANEILKQLLPLIDGKGGGKPDLAQAGGNNPAGLTPALAEAAKILGV